MNEIPEINNEILQKIYSTFKVETKEYGSSSYMFFKPIDEFEKSPKFISVNGSPFRKIKKITAKEHARRYLYKTPTGQFVLISKEAWKEMGYDLINGQPVKQSSD